jgi:hypothetical protein
MSMNEIQLQRNAPTEALNSRWMEEVKGAIFMAKQFPRDQEASLDRILKSCERKTLASKATYVYQRGNETVKGPSIRLAEVLAQNWGNLSSGVIELDQKNGESNCMSYSWDLESNFRDDKIFTVKHERKAQGTIKKLVDPRDIYELVANMGARRKRACILAVIPGDIVDAALAKCEETILKDNKPLIEKIGDLVKAFEEFKITKEMIQKRFEGKKINEKEYLDLLGIYNSLKDNMGKPADYFTFAGKSSETSAENANLNDKLKGKVEGAVNNA